MKSIKGYEGLYSVTEDGRVWSHTTKSWRTLVKNTRGKGYMTLALSANNALKRFYVHQLVATAFIPNPENKLTVNHKDGDVENNHVSNLEWATHQEQIDHAWKEGLVNNYGESCGCAKLSNKQATKLILDYKQGGMSQSYLGSKYGISQSQVSRIISGERRSNQHKGDKNVRASSTLQAIN